jgi:ABC-2 type transport system permease protein
MKALIYKDFIALKWSYLVVFLIMVLTFGYSLANGILLTFPMIFVIIPVIFTGMLFTMDARSKVEQYIIATPVSRKTIVLSRYVPVWFMAGLGSLISLILADLTDTFVSPVPWHLVLSLTLFFNTAASALQLPLMFRFGTEKAKLIYLVFYFVIIAAVNLLGNYRESVAGFLTKMVRIDIRVISIFLILFTILINTVSFAASVAVYKKKEF